MYMFTKFHAKLSTNLWLILLRGDNTMTTDRQTDHGTLTSIAIGKIACQRCRLIYSFIYTVVGRSYYTNTVMLS